MALQVCTSRHHTQLRLETPQNPRDQSRTALIFAESTLLGGGKKEKFLQCAALEKSLPQQPAQLGAPAHICVASCLCRVAASEAQPQGSSEHRDTTGSSAGAPGAGTEWRWQEKPRCWERDRLLPNGNWALSEEFASIWHKSMENKVQVLSLAQLRAPVEAARLEGTHEDHQVQL